MNALPPLFHQLLDEFVPAFAYAPSLRSFLTIAVGWILCSNARTTTGVLRAAGTEASKSHDAYQNFISKAKWDMEALWKTVCFLAVKLVVKKNAPILLAGDDTVCKHWGRKIWGAGVYRDAVRSSKKHVAYCWGLNWVVLCLIVPMPLMKDRHIALPILARLNPKEPKAKNKGRGSKRKQTTVTLMTDMVSLVAGWFPERCFLFCGDGAYASVAKRLPENAKLVSRARKDAALYALPAPPKKGTRGRRPKKGKRLPCPEKLAPSHKKMWTPVTLTLYGKKESRLLWSIRALWYEVYPDALVTIVIVRDPSGKRPDEYFFSTDPAMHNNQTVLTYATRWAIEVLFRECKQYFGMNDPQSRTQPAVLRTTPFCLLLNALVKLWFVLEKSNGSIPASQPDAWYTHKSSSSFQDMLFALRCFYWENRFFGRSTSHDDPQQIVRLMINSLCRSD